MPGRRFLTGWTVPPMWRDHLSRPRRTPRRYGSSSAGEADARFPTGPLRQIQLSWLHHRPWTGIVLELEADHRRHAEDRECHTRPVRRRAEPSPLGPLSPPTAPGWPSRRWPTTWPAGRRGRSGRGIAPRPSDGGSSPWRRLTRTPVDPASDRWPWAEKFRYGPAASHSTPGLTAPSATDGQPKIRLVPARSEEFPAAYSSAHPATSKKGPLRR